mmetsp:Transcript_50345/g.79770  ORF Transcript_50345/g.79770 Transcript_50345/m.79770 type:complete len:252 (-) Transcript_50345:37-792(-)
MKHYPWRPIPASALLSAIFLSWAPSCDASTNYATKDGLLLRRLRKQSKQEPFIVSFRVSISPGIDSVDLANNLSASINTPYSPLANELGYSVARVFNGTFPPVEYPTSTTAGPAQATTPLPPLQPSLHGAAPLTTPNPSAMQEAVRALQLAKENAEAYQALTHRMGEASEAHARALNFENPDGTTPLPTLNPSKFKEALSKQDEALEYPTLGQLIYYAVINTPPPVPLTMPPTTPAPIFLTPSPPRGPPPR